MKSAVQGVLNRYFDDPVTPLVAESIARDNGIKVSIREPDDLKGHGDAVTVDVVVRRGDHTRDSSVRGVLTPEGKPLIRRIDRFENIDIAPEGHLAIFTYDDRPGVSGRIGEAFSAESINILDGRYKTGSDKQHAIAMLQTDRIVAPELLLRVAGGIQAHVAFALSF